MSALTVILFFLYIWGFGFTITRLVQESKNFLERNLMRLGFGLGVFAVLSILINLLRIPLDWKLFFLLSIIVPGYYLYKIIKHKQQIFPSVKLTRSNIIIMIVLVLYLATFFMYHKGAFIYPYLEDDDPWEHVKGAKYVALEKTAFDAGEGKHPYGYFYYMDSYPPAYDIFLGVLHQTNDSVSWTVKFFNALIISLSIIFFYFFVKEFIGNKYQALFATFILAAIPSYFSHFIWASSLSVTLILPALYAFEKIKQDSRWKYVAGVMIGGIAVSQPSSAFKFGILLFTYWLIKSIYSRTWNKDMILGSVFGGILALLWWYNKIFSMAFSLTKGTASMETEAAAGAAGEFASGLSFSGIIKTVSRLFDPFSGSATRPYTFNDFFVAKTTNMINNPIGWGIFITILVVIGILIAIKGYRKLKEKEYSWLSITLAWFVFTFMLVNSATFGTPGFFSFRAWMLLAFPVSILCAVGFWPLMNWLQRVKIDKGIVLIVVILGILLTSAYPKYVVNTAMWGPGGSFQAMEEAYGYAWLKNLPPDTPVFVSCSETPRNQVLPGVEDTRVIGFDKFSCGWCQNIIDYRETAFNQTAGDLHLWLKNKHYEYFTVDLLCVRNYGPDAVNAKLQEYVQSGKFQMVHSNQAFFAFKVI